MIAQFLFLAALLQTTQVAPHARLVGNGRPIDEKLFEAIRQDNEPRVRLLLAKGANPNANEANGWSPLTTLEGYRSTNLPIAKDLVARGAKINYRQPGEGFSALQEAAMSGNAPLVDFYLRHGADPNILTTENEPALTFAIRAGSLPVVRALVGHGARLDIRSTSKNVHLADDRNWEPGFKLSGQTSAFGLAMAFDPAIADFLVKAGVDLHATDDNGWTILHHAVKYGQVKAVNWLTAHGLDPNSPSHRGYRPLHLACSVGLGTPGVEVARALIAAGANPSLKNDKGQTPLDLLRETVAWTLRPSSPAVGLQPDFESKYLEQANALARLLEPHAPAIERPAPTAGKYGRAYEPIGIADVLVLKYWVRREGPVTILRVTFDPPRQNTLLKIKHLWLHSYESLVPGAWSIDLKKGGGFTMENPYPAVAAGGGDLDMDYEFTRDGATGSGSTGEGSRDIEFITGRAVSVAGEEADRTMIVRIESVSLNGKTLKGFSGREYTLHGTQPVATGFPMGRLELRYEIRIPPNKTWEHHQISL